MSDVDNAVRRSTRLRSGTGRSVLGELTNKKSGGADGAALRNAKKPVSFVFAAFICSDGSWLSFHVAFGTLYSHYVAAFESR